MAGEQMSSLSSASGQFIGDATEAMKNIVICPWELSKLPWCWFGPASFAGVDHHATGKGLVAMTRALLIR